MSRDYLYNIFDLVKKTKKPIVKLYPDGRVVGTDLGFASLNTIIHNNISYNLPYPFIFINTEFSAFIREIQDSNEPVIVDNYGIYFNDVVLTNHLEMSFEIDDLYSRVIHNMTNEILYSHTNFEQICDDMLSLKASDGAKLYSIGIDKLYLMSSFNSIHPANKSDRVDLIIRDLDIYSYMAEFIIYKKKDNYKLHEFLRFRKL